MRYSKLFGKTIKEAPADATTASHKLLFQAGFIRESVAGRYYFLPLGNLVRKKIMQIVKEEMDKAGAEEVLAPTLHPLELWQETNRVDSSNFELMTIKDRRGAGFALGGTAEEMIVDLVRKFQISYKDLPFNIYQFSTKFRDEMRAKGGLMRAREFTMKDGYSFHATSEDFEKEYKNMWETYERIFGRLGLDVIAVAADNGYFGGDYCHEFDVLTDVGESIFFVSEDGKYIAHEDIATFVVDDKNSSEEMGELKEVDAVRGNTMEDGVAFHGLPDWQQMKDVMFTDLKGNLYLAIIRGDLDVNKSKLEHVVGKIGQLSAATEEQIRSIGSEPGFISPLGLETKVTIIADKSIRTVKNFYGGANKKNKDVLNMNIDRDFKAKFEADIAMAQEGFESLENHGKLIKKKGVEVGNIFQLGQHYSTLMKNAVFTDANGNSEKYYMGCYGIGIERTLSTIVEVHNDDKGIIWPEAVAPFKVHLVGLNLEDESVRSKAEELYKQLTEQGVEVLFDDRIETRPGEKFADADLIGIPYRVVVSKKSMEHGGFELKKRSESNSEIVKEESLITKLSN